MLRRLATAGLAVALGLAAASPSSAREPTPSRGPIVGTIVMVDLDEQAAIEQEHQRVEAYLAAVAAAQEAQRVADAQADAQAVVWARWTAVGRCEQPGGGDGGVEWTVQSSTFSGGLGISNAAWRQWGGLAYASNAGLASPWEQMTVAETIMAAAGRRAWGCPVP